MLSVHAHARYPHGRFPRGFTPLPLEAAARMLADDRPGADEKHDVPASRRRRAVAKLAAYGLGRPGLAPAPVQRITDAIGVIVEGAMRSGGKPPAPADVAERVSAIVEHVAARPKPGVKARGTAMSTLDAAPVALERSLSDELSLLMGEPSDCWTRLQVSVPAVGESASAWVQVDVDRPLEDVRASIDPQSWDTCSAFFPFGGTYLAAPGSGDYPTAHCAATIGTAETAGSVYGWPAPKVLFEYFVTGVPGFESWFTNLLDIRTTWWSAPTQAAVDTFAVSYSLRRPVCGSVLGVRQKIVVDAGSAVATRHGDGTRIEASKVIRFESALVNASVRAMFEVLFDELAAQMGELACCPVTIDT
jgi:hypothetical protein